MDASARSADATVVATNVGIDSVACDNVVVDVDPMPMANYIMYLFIILLGYYHPMELFFHFVTKMVGLG